MYLRYLSAPFPACRAATGDTVTDAPGIRVKLRAMQTTRCSMSSPLTGQWTRLFPGLVLILLSVLALIIIYSFKGKGAGGFLKELLFHPFGKFPLLVPFNILLNIIEMIAKPVSLALRLFTGGSDCHDVANEDRRVLGSSPAPDELAADLERRAAARRPRFSLAALPGLWWIHALVFAGALLWMQRQGRLRGPRRRGARA